MAIGSEKAVCLTFEGLLHPAHTDTDTQTHTEFVSAALCYQSSAPAAIIHSLANRALKMLSAAHSCVREALRV